MRANYAVFSCGENAYEKKSAATAYIIIMALCLAADNGRN